MSNRIDQHQDRSDEPRSPNLLRLFGQMVMFPLTMFTYGLDLFVKTMQGMQRTADKGMNVMAGEATEAQGGEGHLVGNTTSTVTDGATKGGAETIHEEERNMPDNSLSNDQVKVVEYSILTIKPDDEEILTGPITRVVTDNMTGEDFTSWVIAEYFGKPGHKVIPDNDRKYLRVSYSVTSSFAPEDANYPKEEVEVLRQIRDRI